MRILTSIIIAFILTDVFVDIIRSAFKEERDEVKEFEEKMERMRIKNNPSNY